jgi:hypothetical protein
MASLQDLFSEDGPRRTAHRWGQLGGGRPRREESGFLCHRTAGPQAVLGTMNPRYVALKKVAEQPGYEWASERLLRRLVYERRIPYSKPASRVLINLDDLDQLIEQARVEPVGA